MGEEAWVMCLTWLPQGCLASGLYSHSVSIWQPGRDMFDTAKYIGSLEVLQPLASGQGRPRASEEEREVRCCLIGCRGTKDQ